MDGLLNPVNEARAAGRTLAIRGQGSKAQMFGEVAGEVPLDTTTYQGIERYQPAELVVTARAGTALTDLHAALDERGQMLPFEPPALDGRGTIGGAVASGLSGPARPWWGAVRDAVLGVTLINGAGEVLRFGGEVMKNVAGYDVSRLQVAALGAFGVIAEVSVRVMPKPAAVETVAVAVDRQDTIAQMRAWCRLPLPLAGLCYSDDRLYVRLAGHAAAVADARATIGGEAVDDDIWNTRIHQPCRVFCPPATPIADHHRSVEWAGSLRWADRISNGEVGHTVGSPPAQLPAAMPIALRLKQSFDPQQIFNPGVLHADQSA